jgi:fatty acid desaturase
MARGVHAEINEPMEVGPSPKRVNDKERTMLWTIFLVLVVLWLLGMVSSYTIGGFIHILLVAALAIVLIRIIQGRRPVA